jgi:protein-L-isoaspartate(D-aspartate) O-methyltransferase
MSSKEILVQEIIDLGYLKSPRIIEAFLAIDRKDFVTLDNREEAYADIPLPIGFGQTISQPLTVAFMLELLQPEKGEKILDIGSGSGWTSALLSYLVSDNGAELIRGKVIAIERILELKEFGEKNTVKYNFVKKGIAKFFYADGSKDIPNICSQIDLKGGFDKILCSATVKEIPQEWLKQLKTGGRIVFPFDGEIQLWIKKEDNSFETQSFKGFSFVPLVSGIED